MSQLAQLLRYLDRDDVTEVVLQTDRAPMVRMGGEYRPLGKNPITTQQIEALAVGTPLAQALPQGDAGGAPVVVALFERRYTVRAARRGTALQVRIEAVAGGAARPAPAAPSSGSIEAAKPVGAPAPEAHRAITRPVSIPPDGLRDSSPPNPPTPAPPAIDRQRTTVPATLLAREMQQQGAAPRAPSIVPAAPASVPVHIPAPAPAPAMHAEPAPRAVPFDPGRKMVKGFESLVHEARKRKASDLHIIAERPPMMRTAGDLLPEGDPLPGAEVEKLLLPLLSSDERQALETRGYTDFGLDGGPAIGRLRCNVARQRSGLKGSFRLVMSPTPTLESLGLPPALSRVTTYHQGLVVIAGPNGHGKTTTLAAIVDVINATRPHHILTVEEPVEFLHVRKKALVSQREVGPHTRTFASALKASLREDPDVIVIGELRDRETVEIALTAAETGHLVMATMSTPSAGKTIDRLIDFFPPEDQSQVRATLAGALKFIVAQRLLPSVSGDSFVAAVELLTGVPALWSLIRDNKLFQLPSLQQRGRAFGMIRFDDSLADLVRTGKITEETAMRYAESKKEFQASLRSSGVAAAAAPAAPAAPATPAPAARGIDLKSRMGGFFGGNKKE